MTPAISVRELTKTYSSGAAAERVDTKILETLIELDGGHRLRPGRHVDAFIEVDDSGVSNGAAGTRQGEP